MEAHCPQCSQTMKWVAGHYHCEACLRDYRQLASCPECGQPLQELKACGAVDYLCQNGHGLISKKKGEFQLSAAVSPHSSTWPVFHRSTSACGALLSGINSTISVLRVGLV